MQTIFYSMLHNLVKRCLDWFMIVLDNRDLAYCCILYAHRNLSAINTLWITQSFLHVLCDFVKEMSRCHSPDKVI